MKHFLIFILLTTSIVKAQNSENSEKSSQILFMTQGVAGVVGYELAKTVMPEHGFLPGTKFPTYPTVNKYDFNNMPIKVIMSDNRSILNLKTVNCSTVEITNKSEFNAEKGTVKAWQYLNSLLPQSKIKIDSTSTDVLEVSLDALDCRLIGFGQIAVHGLCQMTFRYHGMIKTYCTDIEDGDRNAPLSKTSFVTRKTASRFMTSASIRETIEKFLSELRSWPEQPSANTH